MMTVPRSATHAKLSEDCRAAHRELDGSPALLRLLQADVTPGEYATALGLLLACHRLIEPALLGAPAQIGESRLASYRERSTLLEQDLLHFGQSITAPAVQCAPPVASRAAYLGIRYVMEGATQGSVHIVRRLLINLPFIRTRAFSYWEFQQAQAAHWPDFLEVLATLDGDAAQQQEAADAASATFGVFLKIFTGHA